MSSAAPVDADRTCLHDIWETRRQQEPGLQLEDPLIAIPSEKVDYDVQTVSTQRVLEDFQADGVVYIELRTTPRATPSQNVSKDDYVKTVLDVLREHNEQESNTMRAFLILSIDRRNTAAEAQEVVDLALKHQSAGVVGVDLCGDPAKGDVSVYRDAFARAKAAGLKITLHFAEIAESGTDEELNTLLSWHPDRLGHVIHVNSSFQERIEKANIGVELCMSCNVHAKLITGTYSDHHFGFWRQTGVPVALCTDDVGVFCSPLSQEYYLAAKHFGLSRSELKELAQRPISTIFTGPEERARLNDIFRRWLD
ncbi:hypothetical protein SLS60_003705 [Paraconiothyrium brasiliense]|uniref:Adenosine deaminase domain-containing protein n=1 Tax=Paraconiothyrium brasiliense TaxID=300254 RepID=A0ABR3RPU5_9PLEO